MKIDNLEEFLAGVWRTMRLNVLLDHGPKAITRPMLQFRKRLQQRRLERSITATRFVPEKELESKYLKALALLTQKTPTHEVGDYLEFGVFNGTSLTCMHRALKKVGIEHVRLFGFDSFEGLPQIAATDDGGTWSPGDFKVPFDLTKGILDRAGIDWTRVSLIKGWFSDTLTRELIQRHQITKASVLMVDCDLYSSAKEALDFSEPLIDKEAVIFFDDWHSDDLDKRNMGEKRAFDEFLAANPRFSYEELPDLRYNKHSKVFRVRTWVLLGLLWLSDAMFSSPLPV